MKNIDKKNFDEFLLEDTEEGTVCDLDGNCVQKHIKRDKSIVERISKKIIIEDGRQLLL
jgi:hypothetical protein